MARRTTTSRGDTAAKGEHAEHGRDDTGHGGDDACPERVIAAAEHRGHTQWDHFPSDAELFESGTLDPTPDENVLARLAATRRFEPFAAPAPALPAARAALALEPESDLRDLLVRPLRHSDLFRPTISAGLARLIASYRRVRRDEATLTRAERDRFNAALAALDGTPAWNTLTGFHVGGTYRMHSMHGAVGRQRFLPWHRRYVFEAERLLRTVDPTLTIPYWNYVAGSARPDWVRRPTGITRPTPGAAGMLPTGGTLATVLARGDYTTFTGDLESNAHNQVHNWCGGTLQSPATASFDPIFWMLHANVDRIWSVWQESHTDPVLHTPTLSGADAVMDPWTTTLAGVDDTAWDLGYRYG